MSSLLVGMVEIDTIVMGNFKPLVSFSWQTYHIFTLIIGPTQPQVEPALKRVCPLSHVVFIDNNSTSN
jgi:hypothetical protein